MKANIKYFAYRMKLRKAFRQANNEIWQITKEEFKREERKRSKQ